MGNEAVSKNQQTNAQGSAKTATPQTNQTHSSFAQYPTADTAIYFLPAQKQPSINELIQRARLAPHTLSRKHILQLHRRFGNRGVMQLMQSAHRDVSTISGQRNQRRADQAAGASSTNLPSNSQPIQRTEVTEEEPLQGKFAEPAWRESISNDKISVQTKWHPAIWNGDLQKTPLWAGRGLLNRNTGNIMNTYADKTQENKSQTVSNATFQNQSSGKPAFQFVDNRPEAMMQRKVIEQLQNSPQAKQAAQVKSMIDHSPYQLKQRQLASIIRGGKNREQTGGQEEHAKSTPVQKKENKTGLPDPSIQFSSAQRASENHKPSAIQASSEYQETENNPPINKTGMPDSLKMGLENLSGMSMDHVRVHYNSSKPAQLNAHAYTQGSEIHVASGQEKHLPHEGWHVVQQAQGRVKPTMQAKGVQINDDAGLEREADVMGGRAIQMKRMPKVSLTMVKNISGIFPIQMVKIRVKTEPGGSYQIFDTSGATLDNMKFWDTQVHPDDRYKLHKAIAFEKWKERVRAIASAHTQTGEHAGQPAAYDLIEYGPFREKSPYEVSSRTHMDKVSEAMGLTQEEEEALYRYSQGQKDERTSPGYMDHEAWKNLDSAVGKIPSMGELGKVATVFRADRKADFTKFLMSRIGKPCYILHGAVSTAVGIPHLASAAFTVNSHGMRKYEVKGKGMQLGKPQELALTRIICLSAKYIQYWGMHGASLDGGEVLIPAGTITYYDGEAPNTELFAGEKRKIFTLVEVSKEEQRKKPLPLFDDFKGDVP